MGNQDLSTHTRPQPHPHSKTVDVSRGPAGHKRRALRCLALASAILLPAAMGLGQVTDPAPASAPATAPAPASASTSYSIGTINLDYIAGGGKPIPLTRVQREVMVNLRPTGDGGFDAPGTVDVKLSDLSTPTPKPMSQAAVDALKLAILKYFNAHGVDAVIVTAKPSDGPNLNVLITVGRVTEVRTVASGDRFATNRENNPAHAAILENSPVATTPPKNTLNKQAIDDYVLWLNRQPGRRVDVALSPAAQDPVIPDAPVVAVDYLVTENKPWQLLAQLSNTGTRDTNEWRERFAFTHYQLTGRDDIFSFDYSTAGFQDSHAFTVSYDLPITADRRVRIRPYALYSEFTASDVGFQGQDFLGSEVVGGVEVITNIRQWRETFLDVIGGVKYEWAKVRNRAGDLTPSTGEAGFFEPYIGVRLSRNTDVSSLSSSVTLLAGFSNAQTDELDKLRVNADQNFALLQFDNSYTTFLEPLIDKAKFDRGEGTLAHELAFAFRGQYAFGNRLIPQNEETAGGLYTVRGYPESATAGDTVLLASAEYRLHIPRLLAIDPDPKPWFAGGRPFRKSPQTKFGSADWDLIGRAFFDAAQTVNHDRLPFEHDNTLVGVGLGVELQYRENFAFRVDWGVALTEVRSGGVNTTDPGDNRFHFVFTASY